MATRCLLCVWLFGACVRVGVRLGADVQRKGQAGGQKEVWEILVEVRFEPATSVVLT